LNKLKDKYQKVGPAEESLTQSVYNNMQDRSEKIGDFLLSPRLISRN